MEESMFPASESNPVQEPSADRSQEMAELAGRLGHDLNNLIGIVSGRAELLQMHLQRRNVESALKGVDIILAQMDRMRALSDSLRNLRKDV